MNFHLNKFGTKVKVADYVVETTSYAQSTPSIRESERTYKLDKQKIAEDVQTTFRVSGIDVDFATIRDALKYI